MAGMKPFLGIDIGGTNIKLATVSPTARVVETNRTVPPDFIIMKADALSGGQPFAGSIDDLVSRDELRRISEDYQKVAGFSLEALKA